MAIESICLSDVSMGLHARLERLADGLNIIVGPNGSGKSRLVDCLRQLLVQHLEIAQHDLAPNSESIPHSIVPWIDRVFHGSADPAATPQALLRPLIGGDFQSMELTGPAQPTWQASQQIGNLESERRQAEQRAARIPIAPQPPEAADGETHAEPEAHETLQQARVVLVRRLEQLEREFESVGQPIKDRAARNSAVQQDTLLRKLEQALNLDNSEFDQTGPLISQLKEHVQVSRRYARHRILEQEWNQLRSTIAGLDAQISRFERQSMRNGSESVAEPDSRPHDTARQDSPPIEPPSPLQAAVAWVSKLRQQFHPRHTTANSAQCIQHYSITPPHDSRKLFRQIESLTREVSGDRVSRLRFVPSSSSILAQFSGQQTWIDVQRLSRGIQQVVNLSVRLTLAQGLQECGFRCPFVLDSCLTDVDSRSLSRVLTVLQDHSQQGLQILWLSSQSSLGELAQNAEVNVQWLEKPDLEPEDASPLSESPEPQSAVEDEAGETETAAAAVEPSTAEMEVPETVELDDEADGQVDPPSQSEPVLQRPMCETSLQPLPTATGAVREIGSSLRPRMARRQRRKRKNPRHGQHFLEINSPITDCPTISRRLATRLDQHGVSSVGKLLEIFPDTFAEQRPELELEPVEIFALQSQCLLAVQVPLLNSAAVELLVSCGITTPRQLAQSAPDRLYRRIAEELNEPLWQARDAEERTDLLREVGAWIRRASRARSLWKSRDALPHPASPDRPQAA